MGCELCNNAKTQKEEASLTRQANLPVLKKSEPITISNNIIQVLLMHIEYHWKKN